MDRETQRAGQRDIWGGLEFGVSEGVSGETQVGGG